MQPESLLGSVKKIGPVYLTCLSCVGAKNTTQNLSETSLSVVKKHCCHQKLCGLCGMQYAVCWKYVLCCSRAAGTNPRPSSMPVVRSKILDLAIFSSQEALSLHFSFKLEVTITLLSYLAQNLKFDKS